MEQFCMQISFCLFQYCFFFVMTLNKINKFMFNKQMSLENMYKKETQIIIYVL